MTYLTYPLAVLIIALVQTVSTPLYSAIFGLPKRRVLTHPNRYLRFVASILNPLAVMFPLFYGVSAYLVFPIAIALNLLLQKFADDYMSE